MKLLRRAHVINDIRITAIRQEFLVTRGTMPGKPAIVMFETVRKPRFTNRTAWLHGFVKANPVKRSIAAVGGALLLFGFFPLAVFAESTPLEITKQVSADNGAHNGSTAKADEKSNDGRGEIVFQELVYHYLTSPAFWVDMAIGATIALFPFMLLSGYAIYSHVTENQENIKKGEK